MKDLVLELLDHLAVGQRGDSLVLEDEPDGDVQNAGGGVVVELERFEVEGVDSVAHGRQHRGAVAGTGGGFPSLQHLPLRSV